MPTLTCHRKHGSTPGVRPNSPMVLCVTDAACNTLQACFDSCKSSPAVRIRTPSYLDLHLMPFLHFLHLPVLVAKLSLSVIQVLFQNLPEGIDFVLHSTKDSQDAWHEAESHDVASQEPDLLLSDYVTGTLHVVQKCPLRLATIQLCACRKTVTKLQEKLENKPTLPAWQM